MIPPRRIRGGNPVAPCWVVRARHWMFPQALRREARGLRGAAPSAPLCTRPSGSRTRPETQTTTAAQPAPEEFDNSTYQNFQHHEYGIYTFVDFDVVLSKFRQPQPSSGRPSPRH
uniref:NADH:ubiquinone oxidoreductase subunit V3 n=1 Tax=Dromaius novaehollandiae TaxID=8790 RepID=A0A8C4JGF2_DRONO